MKKRKSKQIRQPVAKAKVELKWLVRPLVKQPLIAPLDLDLMCHCRDYTPDQMEELAIRFEMWTKQLRLCARRMRQETRENN